jgi:non-specific serine/threonine protein kinase
MRPEEKECNELVFNFYLYERKFYLPEAYIVSVDENKVPMHVRQKAFSHTISAFNIELTPDLAAIFNLIDQLDPDQLLKKLEAKKRKNSTLTDFADDRIIWKKITLAVDKAMGELLPKLIKGQFLLFLGLNRRVLAKDFQLKIAQEVLKPYLAFRKNESNVEYKLRLGTEEEVWSIKEKEVIPISNMPGWLVVDGTLFQVESINANLVKPFQEKDTVHIPADSVKSYFKQFIVKIVEKADIEAEGFDFEPLDQLTGCQIIPIQHLFTKKWILSVKMVYRNFSFQWSDSKQRKTFLEFEQEEFSIAKIQRNMPQEKRMLQFLFDHPDLELWENYFVLQPELEDKMNVIEWLSEKKGEWMDKGFEIIAPEVGHQTIQLERPTIQLKSNTEKDWFDIHGWVKIGPFEFPFKNLMRNIRLGDRYYPLDDGSLFLIPEEWFSRFKALAQFASEKNEGLTLEKNQFTLLEELGLQGDALPSSNYKEIEFIPSEHLQANLRPYQIDGVKWLIHLYNHSLGGCLADDMGLGKTLQTIALLLHVKGERARQTATQNDDLKQLDLFNNLDQRGIFKTLGCLIVLPASLVFNWRTEIAKFAPVLSVYVHTGSKRQKDTRILSRYDIILTTYQTALRDADLLEEMDFEYIILDESQQIKNRESKVFKSLNGFKSRYKLSLSGTPIENSLSDLWSQMQFINPNLLGSFSFFKKEFLNPIEKFGDEEKKDRLKTLVKPYLLRRTKEQVATDLPPLSTSVFYAHMTTEQKQLYEREKSAARNLLLDNFSGKKGSYKLQVIKTLTRLRQLVNHPVMVDSEYGKQSGKFQDVIEHWEVIRRSGHKVLFFSSFVKHLELFKAYFEQNNQKYSWISGDSSSAEREKAVKSFETESSIQAFLISIKAGGTGLNLTAADYVFILDPWWNPFIEDQAIARAHRIGQVRKVMAIKFITSGSIEEKIMNLQKKKSQLAADIIDLDGGEMLSEKDIQYLLS